MTGAGKQTLAADGLSLHWATRTGERIYAVEDVSFSLGAGEILGIAGESGCGKSTLASGCTGLFLPPLRRTSGDVRLAGQSIVDLPHSKLRSEILGRRVSMIPQGALNSLNPTRKIGKLGADVMLSHRPDMKTREARNLLAERFEVLGLDSKRVLDAYACELSGGMRQRSVIGISTLMNPEVVIADEPTSALDVSTQKTVIETLLGLMDRRVILSMVFITHELPLLRHVAHRTAVMYAGEIVELGATEQVLFDPAHPYTRALMGSVLQAEARADAKRPTALKGSPPKLDKPPIGCRFCDRCHEARPDCATTKQLLEPRAGRLVRCGYAG